MGLGGVSNAAYIAMLDRRDESGQGPIPWRQTSARELSCGQTFSIDEKGDGERKGDARPVNYLSRI